MEIMHTLPLIFQSDSTTIPTRDFQIQQNNAVWTEFVNHPSQFGEYSIPETKDQLALLLDHNDSLENKAMLLTGIARCQIHQGDFIAGAKNLGNAYSLVEGLESNAIAFVYSEMGSFLGITAQYDLGLLILDKAVHICNNEYLMATVNYYRSVIFLRKGDYEQIDELVKSARYFSSINEFSTVAYHYKNIANGYRKLKQFTTAYDFYQKALAIAEKFDYDHIKSAVLHDLALLKFHENNTGEAMSTLYKALAFATSDYAKTCIHSTRAVIYKAGSNLEEGARYFQKALSIASEKGVYSMIPSIAYNLSLCKNLLGDLDASRYMLKVSYDASVELLDQHFPFTGDRKRAVLAYVDDLKTRSTESEVPINHELSFSLDKSLKDIRGLFQSTALKMLKEYSGKTRQVSEDLQISPRSIFTIQNRTSSYATGDPPEYIAEFVKKNKGLNWHELNKKFEENVFSYLYDQYGQQKKMMSEKLEISYPHFVKMTQDIKL